MKNVAIGIAVILLAIVFAICWVFGKAVAAFRGDFGPWDPQ